ncbi:MAG: disulfide bond formation protein B [Simkaniaceae bacterium]|nr:disulfide bond formation protein B [Simkaniaceae bacterium]
MIRYKLIQFLNALWILILLVVLIGAYIYQIVERENPCPLCELIRLSMICVSIGPMLNLRFCPHPRHYALSLAGAIFGGCVAIRQICLHICPDFTTYGVRVFGMELYTWAFIVFGCSIVAATILLALYRSSDSQVKHETGYFEWIVMIAMLIIAILNIFTAFAICGFTACPR